MDNGLAYVRIRSQDIKKALQIFIICTNHERNRDTLKEQPIPMMAKKFKDVENALDFCHMLL